MYKLYQRLQDGSYRYFKDTRRKADAEKVAYLWVRFMRSEHVRVYYNGKKVEEFLWLRSDTGRCIRVMNITHGNFKSCLI